MESEDGTGTGVVINDKCILTAAHVVPNGGAKVTTLSKTAYDMKRVLYDEAKDIAVLCTGTVVDAPPVKIGKAPPAYSPVYTIGFPLHFSYVLTEGRFQNDTLSTTECAPGNSGGGVFDETTGAYVGLVDATPLYQHGWDTFNYSHLCVLVAVADITPLLDANHIQYTKEE